MFLFSLIQTYQLLTCSITYHLISVLLLQFFIFTLTNFKSSKLVVQHFKWYYLFFDHVKFIVCYVNGVSFGWIIDCNRSERVLINRNIDWSFLLYKISSFMLLRICQKIVSYVATLISCSEWDCQLRYETFHFMPIVKENTLLIKYLLAPLKQMKNNCAYPA